MKTQTKLCEDFVLGSIEKSMFGVLRELKDLGYH